VIDAGHRLPDAFVARLRDARERVCDPHLRVIQDRDWQVQITRMSGSGLSPAEVVRVREIVESYRV
jgi:hypothetical protein